MSHTEFDPQVNGFAFNNAWHADEREQHLIRGSLLATLLLAGLRMPFIARRWSRLTLWSLFVGVLLASLKLDSLVYGLCGGMAFTVLDFYSLGWKIPARFSASRPTHETVEGRVLRDYIWKRTLDSLWANTGSFLKWMLILHFHPDAQRLLRDLTCKELARLKAHLDSGTPWPIGLIGTTWSPLNNHQVLAFGYDEDAARGTIGILLYDSSCPSCTSTLSFDSREFVSLNESCFNRHRGPVQGIFCEGYSPAQPPLSLLGIEVKF